MTHFEAKADILVAFIGFAERLDKNPVTCVQKVQIVQSGTIFVYDYR